MYNNWMNDIQNYWLRFVKHNLKLINNYLLICVLIILYFQLETSKKIIKDSEIREQSYIQRLSELEQQLQKEKAKEIKPVDQSEKIEMLTKSMDNLVLEQENLQSLLNEKVNVQK